MLNVLRTITPKFLLSWYHFLWALLGALVYRFPAQGMVIVGVTGTNGKSTTVDMISRIFKEAGLDSASLSSVRFQIRDKEWRNKMKMTMPGRFAVQRFFRQARDSGCTHVVLEVTSEGMLQHRHGFLNFHTAVFTNLSPEHIERHGSFEKYKQTKGKLFQSVKKVHVINVDDERAEYFLQFPAEKLYTYGISPKSSLGTMHIQGKEVKEDEKLEFQVESTKFSLGLLGSFNVYNALAAIAAARSQGISLEVCKKALEQMKVVPGRMEKVVSVPFSVVVDYAFTPAALEKVYKTLKPSQGKLVCVLGAAGGGRDSWKRPVLGKIASAHCDNVIVTNEDPYEEDPEKIINEVLLGAKERGQKILDRREAIREALLLAKPGGAVVITGKGSEDSIAVKDGKKIPWDDREVVREEWTKLKEHGKL
tara:strand:+ start:194 stop:1456 length:1263 start_codon:yes stop_codon:yes gene_type:complete